MRLSTLDNPAPGHVPHLGRVGPVRGRVGTTLSCSCLRLEGAGRRVSKRPPTSSAGRRDALAHYRAHLEHVGAERRCPHGCRPGSSLDWCEDHWRCPACGDEFAPEPSEWENLDEPDPDAIPCLMEDPR